MLATVIDLSRLGDPGGDRAECRGHQGAYPHVARRARVRRGAAARRTGAARRTAAGRDRHRGGCDDVARHPRGRGEARHHRGGDRPGGAQIRLTRAANPRWRARPSSELTCRCSWLRHKRIAGAEQRQIGSGRQLIEIRHGDAEEPNALWQSAAECAMSSTLACCRRSWRVIAAGKLRLLVNLVEVGQLHLYRHCTARTSPGLLAPGPDIIGHGHDAGLDFIRCSQIALEGGFGARGLSLPGRRRQPGLVPRDGLETWGRRGWTPPDSVGRRRHRPHTRMGFHGPRCALLSR